MQAIFRLVVALAVVGAVIMGCSKKKDDDPYAPKASFSISGEAIAGSSVSFNNESLNGATYEWDFGDGTKSTEKNPKKIYALPGTYTVKLIVYSNGKAHTYTKTITVSVAPRAMRVTRVQVTDFPAYNNGDYWDSSITGTLPPDIYVSMSAPGASFTGGRYNNVSKSDLPLSWNVGNFTVSSLSSKMYIYMYDGDDLDADDYMGGYNLIPQDEMGRTIIDVWNGSTAHRFKLYVEWLY